MSLTKQELLFLKLYVKVILIHVPNQFHFSKYAALDPAQAATQLIARKISLSLPKGTNSTVQKIFDGCMKWEPKQRPNFTKICKWWGF